MRKSCLILSCAAALATAERPPRQTDAPLQPKRAISSDFATHTAAAVHVRQNIENIEIHSAYATFDNIEIHKDYFGPIGTDTGVLAPDGSTTKWIGVNTEYLTELTVTTTVNNAVTTTTEKPAVAIATITEAADGLAVGDVTVFVAEKIQNEIGDIINKGVAACAGAQKRRLRKRSDSCLLDYLTNSAKSDEVLAGLSGEEFQKLVLGLAEHAPELLGAAYSVLASQAQKNKLAILFAAAITAGAFGAKEALNNVGDLTPHKFKFSQGQVGQPASGSEEENNDKKSCDPAAKANENSPVCEDNDCKGDTQTKKCQAEGKNKGCACGLMSKSVWGDNFNFQQMEEMQKLLEASINEDLPEESVKCDIIAGGFPAKNFYSDDYKITKNFCPRWKENQGRTTNMVVNEAGDEMPKLRKRTPPMTLEDLFDWRAELGFEATENGGDCTKDCDEAFAAFARGCSSTNTGVYMYPEGSFNAGCGTFKYKLIAPPKQETTPSEQPEQPPAAPQINEPPARTICNGNSDCEKYTCKDDGHKAHCQSGAAGDPFTSYCEC